MTRFVIVLAMLLQSVPSPAPSSAPSPAPSPSPSASPAALAIVGQVLAIQDGYLVFTTGDALRIAAGTALPARLRLGAFVRVRLDPATHAIAVIALARSGAPGDLDAAQVPRQYVVASPKSLRTAPPAGAAGNGGQQAVATITIDVQVPDSTPLGDDVYLATDRSNFSAAEIRMLRVDSRHFSVSLRLPAGAQLQYEFTRGSFTSIERDRLGGIVDPRAIDVKGDATLHDSVARWADVN